MRHAWVLVSLLLAATAMAGCTQQGDPNPHLLAPKLTIAPIDDTHLEIYIHSAVGEHLYDHLALHVDNQTVETRETTHAIIHRIPNQDAALTIEARIGDTHYTYTGLLDVTPGEPTATLITLEDGEETERKTVDLPYTKLIERTDTR